MKTIKRRVCAVLLMTTLLLFTVAPPAMAAAWWDALWGSVKKVAAHIYHSSYIQVSGTDIDVTAEGTTVTCSDGSVTIRDLEILWIDLGDQIANGDTAGGSGTLSSGCNQCHSGASAPRSTHEFSFAGGLGGPTTTVDVTGEMSLQLDRNTDVIELSGTASGPSVPFTVNDGGTIRNSETGPWSIYPDPNVAPNVTIDQETGQFSGTVGVIFDAPNLRAAGGAPIAVTQTVDGNISLGMQTVTSTPASSDWSLLLLGGTGVAILLRGRRMRTTQ